MADELKINKPIISNYDARLKDWCFSIIDVVGLITGSDNPENMLKQLRSENAEIDEFIKKNCKQFGYMKTNSSKISTILGAYSKEMLEFIKLLDLNKYEQISAILSKENKRLYDILNPEKAILKGDAFLKSKGFTDKWIKENKK